MNVNDRYKFRGLPCTGRTWHVSGGHDSGGGVLEWCDDKEDAKYVIRIMRRYREFSKLRVGNWPDDVE